MQPFFSIIIPLYNKENHILDTLKSALNQTFKNFEIIVINDGSTDNSFQIVKNFIDNHNLKISLITQENKGLSTTRNKGIQIATGKIIALLDADDEWEPNYLKEIHSLYNKFPDVSFFGTDYKEFHNNTKYFEPKKTLPKNLKSTTFIIDDFFKYNLGQPIICPSSFSFKKEIFQNFQFDTSINYSEDIDFYIQVFKTNCLAYSYKPLVKLKLNVPNQMTSTGIKNKNITNLDKYENEAKKQLSLKKYLDFYRYLYASQYKRFGDTHNFKLQLKYLNYNNLTYKQRLILKLPKALSKQLTAFKNTLLKANIKWSTY